jgi:CRISPR-associated protein Cas1
MKKTLCFSSPAYLSVRLRQLEIEQPAEQEGPVIKTTVPIEEIGVIILENPRITITQVALAALLEENCAVVTCNHKYLPTGLMLPLDGHTLQTRRFRNQIEASVPLKKQLWQQTVRQKIMNQARLINRQGMDGTTLLRLFTEVRSGDPDNIEARAAVWYWSRIFQKVQFSIPEDGVERPDDFIRDRYGDWPNSLLNYGYAILRAVIARSLVGAGLLPTLGIFHRNQYNAYCLADDIMEPYRPSVDGLVMKLVQKFPKPEDSSTGQLSPALKRELLVIPVMDVLMENKMKPLQVAAQRTAASLAACFAGDERTLLYPEFL